MLKADLEKERYKEILEAVNEVQINFMLEQHSCWIYRFADFLLSKDNPVTISSQHSPEKIVALVEEFLKESGLPDENFLE